MYRTSMSNLSNYAGLCGNWEQQDCRTQNCSQCDWALFWRKYIWEKNMTIIYANKPVLHLKILL